MHPEYGLLKDIVVVISLAVGVLFLRQRLRVPVIVGYLVTGVLVGPSGVGLMSASADVELLAEIGVVLLLFSIGVEFSFRHLVSIWRIVMIGGGLQVLATTAVVLAASRTLGFDWGTSTLFGFLAALSSTAIVMKSLQERGQIDATHGRLALGILVFQDILIAPMVLLIPLLAGVSGEAFPSWSVLIGKASFVVLMVIVAARWVVPWILYHATATRNKELFQLAVLAICFGVAFMSVELGLSLALGAFFAGLIISESEYSHQALGNIIPFRDAFVSLFFISIGMLLDLSFAAGNILTILLLALALMFGKTLVITVVSLLLAAPLRASLIAGLSLSQIGEFSFVLSKVGVSHGLMTHESHQLFLAVAIFSMILTPLLIAAAPRLAEYVAGLPLMSHLANRVPRGIEPPPSRKDHLIIVGYGENGRNLANACKTFNLPYIIVEMNPDTVLEQQRRGEPIFYGDASYPSVLEAAGIHEARQIVVGIPDAAGTRQIVQLAKLSNPRVHVIARTQLVKETGDLFELGADDVVPLEYETAIEISTRMLNQFLVPRNDIDDFVRGVRRERYEAFRRPPRLQAPICDWQRVLPGLTLYTLRVVEGAYVANKRLDELDLRRRLGATLLAIHRDGKVIANPKPSSALLPDDVIVVMTHGEHFKQLEAEVGGATLSPPQGGQAG